MEKNLDSIQEQIDQQNDDNDQVLSFILGKEEYGVDILRVQEIKGWEHTTPIPNTPKFVMGVINLRGAVVPIIDLRIRFGLEEMVYDDTTVVIIVRSEDAVGTQKIIGLVVDGVSDVYTIQAKKLQTAPDMSGRVQSDYIQGLATINEKLIVILHVDPLINEGILAQIKKSLTI